MNSPARHGNEYRNLDRLRRLHHELTRLTDQLKTAPPRYQAEAARLIAANEDVLSRNARLLADAAKRVRTEPPRRNVLPVTEGNRFVAHHKVISH